MGEFVQGFRLADKVEWVYKAASVAGTDLVEDVPRAPLRVGEAFVSGGPSVGRCGCWRSMPARQVVVQLAGVVIVHDHSIHLLIVLSALFGQKTILTFVAREAGRPPGSPGNLGSVHGVSCNSTFCFSNGARKDRYSMVRLTARSPVINELAKELALHLAPMGHELVGIHIWSEVNVTADAFEQGRVNEGHCLQSCVHSRREVLSPRGVSEWICLKTLRGTHCDLSGK